MPADIAQGLRLAFAKGEYFNKAIRDRFEAVPGAGPGVAPGQGKLL